MSRPTTLLAFAVLLFCRAGHAREFRLERQWVFRARAEALAAAAVDYDHTCAKGCAHRAPRLTRATILPQERTPNDFYVWMFVEDIQDSKWFSKVTVQRDARGVHVELRMVPPETAQALAKSTGKSNDPGFERCTTRFDFEEVKEAGKFKETRVHMVNTVSISGLGAVFGGGVVESRLDESARATYEDFSKVPVEPKPAR